jgi:hypothetical protein
MWVATSAAITGYFLEENLNYNKDQYRHMLYKPYRVTGYFDAKKPTSDRFFTRENNPIWERFVTLKDPEPASLREGICFKFEGPVLDRCVSRDGSRRLTVIVRKGRSWEGDRTVHVKVKDEERRIENGQIWRFKGKVMPTPKDSRPNHVWSIGQRPSKGSQATLRKHDMLNNICTCNSDIMINVSRFSKTCLPFHTCNTEGLSLLIRL